MSERGFSLVEAVVAIAILGTVVIGILPAFTVQFSSNTRNEVRSGAVAVTQIVIEDHRMDDPTTMPTGGSDAPVFHSIGNRDYEAITHYCLRNEYCDTYSRHLLVEVFLDNRKVYDVETIFVKLR